MAEVAQGVLAIRRKLGPGRYSNWHLPTEEGLPVCGQAPAAWIQARDRGWLAKSVVEAHELCDECREAKAPTD